MTQFATNVYTAHIPSTDRKFRLCDGQPYEPSAERFFARDFSATVQCPACLAKTKMIDIVALVPGLEFGPAASE